MIDKVCYKIAGHLVLIEGEHSVMGRLVGFERFAVPLDGYDFKIDLDETSDDGFGSDNYYTLETPLLSCCFTQHATGYGMCLKPHDGDNVLFLRYDCAKCTGKISGNLKAGMLKFALWVAFGLAALEQHTVAVHASAVIHKGKAILFLGESGTGKSTHARLWQEHVPGVELLNDDSPILRIEDGKCYAYGSPWSGKTPCYQQAKVELTAIVRLSQASENRISRLRLHEAVGALYPSFPPAFSSHGKLAEPIYSILSGVLRQIPVYYLECLPDKEAALLACRTISHHAL